MEDNTTLVCTPCQPFLWTIIARVLALHVNVPGCTINLAHYRLYDTLLCHGQKLGSLCTCPSCPLSRVCMSFSTSPRDRSSLQTRTSDVVSTALMNTPADRANECCKQNTTFSTPLSCACQKPNPARFGFAVEKKPTKGFAQIANEIKRVIVLRCGKGKRRHSL